jgi:hypothetical protein
MLPIGMALAEQIGFSRGSNGRIGIATALALACNMPSFAVLPANIPNMILSGASENLFNVHFGYAEYLFLHFPILGLLKSAIIVALVVYLFPAKIDKSQIKAATDIEAYDVAKQVKLSVLLIITLLFWVTDSWHGINPAWVGLTTAIILLLPKWGIIEPKRFNQSVDFSTVIFVAAALGLGTLVNQSGLGNALGQMFSQYFPLSQGGSFLIADIDLNRTGSNRAWRAHGINPHGRGLGECDRVFTPRGTDDASDRFFDGNISLSGGTTDFGDAAVSGTPHPSAESHLTLSADNFIAADAVGLPLVALTGMDKLSFTAQGVTLDDVEHPL